LSRSSKKLLDNINDKHRFTAVELDWLALFWSTTVAPGKLPTFQELTKVFPSFGVNDRLFGELFRVLDRNKNSVLDFEV
jgi:hypothetical protein